MASPSNVINRDALDASVTTFRAVMEEMFTSAGNDALVQAFCAEVAAENGQSYQAVFQDFLGTWLEFSGAREVSPTRAYTLSISLSTYAQSMQIARKDLQYDKIGTVAARIRQFLSAQKSYKDALLHDMLALNSYVGPLAYDGVFLYSTSHPNGPAGNQSNTGTAALSPISFNSAYSGMTGLLRENGEPFRVVPETLTVGPGNREMGLSITKGEFRSKPIANTGVEAGAAVVATAAVSNVNAGLVELLVDERLVGARALHWYLNGTAPGGAKGVIYLNGMPPTEQLDVDPNSASVQSTDRFTYGLIADGKFAAGAWQATYFSTGAA